MDTKFSKVLTHKINDYKFLQKFVEDLRIPSKVFIPDIDIKKVNKSCNVNINEVISKIKSAKYITVWENYTDREIFNKYIKFFSSLPNFKKITHKLYIEDLSNYAKDLYIKYLLEVWGKCSNYSAKIYLDKIVPRKTQFGAFIIRFGSIDGVEIKLGKDVVPGCISSGNPDISYFKDKLILYSKKAFYMRYSYIVNEILNFFTELKTKKKEIFNYFSENVKEITIDFSVHLEPKLHFYIWEIIYI